MSKSIFENAWRFLKVTDVRVTPEQFAEMGEGMNVPEIQQLIDPDPAINLEEWNFLGRRPLGPLEGQHRAGGWMGRGGRKVDAPAYLEMITNQPFSADTLAALRGADFTVFGRRLHPGRGHPLEVHDKPMEYHIKGGGYGPGPSRPATDEEIMRITTNPDVLSENYDAWAAIYDKLKEENIANRKKGINPNVAYRQEQAEKRQKELEAYYASDEYKAKVAKRKAREAEEAERRRIAEEKRLAWEAEYKERLAAEEAERRAIREAERQKEEAARAEHEAMLIRRREEKQRAHEAQQKLEASPEYREQQRLEQQAQLERERQRSKNNQKGRFIPVRRGRRGGKR